VKAENNEEMISHVCFCKNIHIYPEWVLEDKSLFRMENFIMVGAKELSLVFV